MQEAVTQAGLDANGTSRGGVVRADAALNDTGIGGKFEVLRNLGLAVTLAVFAMMLFRFPLEDYVDRGTFTIAYGICASALALVLLTRARRDITTLSVVIYSLYLLVRLLATPPTTSIAAISWFQYQVPLAFLLIGAHLWRSRRYVFVIRVLVIGMLISLFAGLANIYAGWGDAIFARFDFERTTVEGVVLHRGCSLAGLSLGTGFLAMLGILLCTARPRWQRLAVPVFVLSLLNTLSRGALVMLGGGLSVWAALRLWGRDRRGRWRSAGGIAALVVTVLGVIGVLALASPQAAGVYGSRYFGDTLNWSEQGNVVRLESWRGALGLWLHSPTFGGGLGTLGSTAVEYGVREFAPESMYLKILGELGLVGLILYLLTIGSVLRNALAALRAGPNRARELPEALLASVSAILVGGLFLQNIEYDLFAVLFWFLMGGLWEYNRAWKGGRASRDANPSPSGGVSSLSAQAPPGRAAASICS